MTWEEWAEAHGIDPADEREKLRWENAKFLGAERIYHGAPLSFSDFT